MTIDKRRKRADAWLDEAIYDFDTCNELHKLGRFNWVCNCCQQVNESFPIENKEFITLRHCASELDPHYIETRYPDAISGTRAPYKYYDNQRSAKCLENAGRILEWVKKQIQ